MTASSGCFSFGWDPPAAGTRGVWRPCPSSAHAKLERSPWAAADAVGSGQPSAGEGHRALFVKPCGERTRQSRQRFRARRPAEALLRLHQCHRRPTDRLRPTTPAADPAAQCPRGREDVLDLMYTIDQGAEGLALTVEVIRR